MLPPPWTAALPRSALSASHGAARPEALPVGPPPSFGPPAVASRASPSGPFPEPLPSGPADPSPFLNCRLRLASFLAARECPTRLTVGTCCGPPTWGLLASDLHPSCSFCSGELAFSVLLPRGLPTLSPGGHRGFTLAVRSAPASFHLLLALQCKLSYISLFVFVSLTQLDRNLRRSVICIGIPPPPRSLPLLKSQM